MASNPLQIPVAGGGMRTPIAGIQLDTPMLSGPPVVQNRTVSDIMDILSGTANLAIQIGSNEIRLRENEERKQKLSEEETKRNNEELDRNELRLLSVKFNSMMVDSERIGPDVVRASDKYKELSDSLQVHSSDESRSPFFRAESSQLLAQLESRLNSEQRTRDIDARQAQEEASRREREYQYSLNAQANVLSESINQEILRENPELGSYSPQQITQMFNNIYNNFGDQLVGFPQVWSSLETKRLELEAKAIDRETKEKKAENIQDFVNSAAIPKADNMYQLMYSKDSEGRLWIDNPEIKSRSISEASKGIENLFASNPNSTLTDLSIIASTWENIKNTISSESGQYTNSQRDVLDTLTSKYNTLWEREISKISNISMAKANKDIEFAMMSSTKDLTPEDLRNIVINNVNDQLGTAQKLLKYDDAIGFYTDNTYGDLASVAVGASDIYQRLLSSYAKNAPKREAFKNIINNPVIENEDLKTAEFDPNAATIQQIDFVSKKLRKGSDLGIFKDFVQSTFSNPRLPNGDFDWDNIEKSMVVLNNMDVARSILLDGSTVINDAITQRILRASVWAELNRVKNSGAIADPTVRKTIAPIVGGTQNRMDNAHAARFIFESPDISGTKSLLDVHQKEVVAPYGKNTTFSPQIVQLLKYAHRVYKTDNPTIDGLSDADVAKAYHKTILSSVGISLVDNGNETYYPVNDPVGIAPSKPLESAKRVLNIVPETGSRLHYSSVANLLGRLPTEEEFKKAEGRSIGQRIKMFSTGNEGINTDNLSISSTFVPVLSEDMLPKVNGRKFISDFGYEELFSFGSQVTDSGNNIGSIKINRFVEDLLPTPTNAGKWILYRSD